MVNTKNPHNITRLFSAAALAALIVGGFVSLVYTSQAYAFTSDSPEASLSITTIDQVNTTAVAGGGFESGWTWVFHITVPSNETSLSMKFSSWTNSNGTDRIAVPKNMRISSVQANSSSLVLLTAADTYSIPLTLINDTDPNTPGRQVEIKVEMQVPTNSANGSYTSNYGIKTQ